MQVPQFKLILTLRRLDIMARPVVLVRPYIVDRQLDVTLRKTVLDFSLFSAILGVVDNCAWSAGAYSRFLL
jgi:hypothetical protein